LTFRFLYAERHKAHPPSQGAITIRGRCSVSALVYLTLQAKPHCMFLWLNLADTIKFYNFQL